MFYILHVSSCKEYSFDGAGIERDESSVWGNVLSSLQEEQSNTKVMFGKCGGGRTVPCGENDNQSA
jgi:hypothetical protein